MWWQTGRDIRQSFNFQAHSVDSPLLKDAFPRFNDEHIIWTQFPVGENWINLSFGHRSTIYNYIYLFFMHLSKPLFGGPLQSRCRTTVRLFSKTFVQVTIIKIDPLLFIQCDIHLQAGHCQDWTFSALPVFAPYTADVVWSSWFLSSPGNPSTKLWFLACLSRLSLQDSRHGDLGLEVLCF